MIRHPDICSIFPIVQQTSNPINLISWKRGQDWGYGKSWQICYKLKCIRVNCEATGNLLLKKYTYFHFISNQSMNKACCSYNALFIFWGCSVQCPQIEPWWHAKSSVESHRHSGSRRAYHFNVRASDSRDCARPTMTAIQTFTIVP